jgi:hypothetical protein
VGNGKTPARCTGITTAGKQCSFNATQGDRCRKHPISKQPPPPPVDHGIRYEFWDIAREVWLELKGDKAKGVAPLDIPPGARPAYWNIIVNCVRNAKEDEARNRAANIVYHIVYTDPLAPEGDVPPMPELPEASG